MFGKRLRHARGFTLIELMVAIAVLTIVVGVAVPGFQSFMANQRVKSIADELAFSLMLAKSEAIKRKQQVIVSANGGNWDSGWVVKTSAETLRQVPQAGVTISGVSLTEINFGPAGRPGLSGASSIDFSICDVKKAATERQLRLSLAGQTRVSLGGACADE